MCYLRLYGIGHMVKDQCDLEAKNSCFKKTQLHFPLYLFQHTHTICVDQSSVDEMYNIFLGKLFSGKTVHESFMVMDETSQTCHRQIFNGVTPY